MPELTRYHLHPGGAFHLGRRGLGQETTDVFIPADTLFAAMISAWLEVGRDPADLVELFVPDSAGAAPPVPFLLTSAFPRAGQVNFYPIPPLGRLPFKDDLPEERLKELKRIRFVSEAIFVKAVAGEPLDDWLPAAKENRAGDLGLFLQGSSLWLTAAELPLLPESIRLTEKGQNRPVKAFRSLAVWRVAKTPRVTVDRLTNSSNIYYTGRLRFRDGCGLWFGLVWRQAEQLVGDSGLTAQQAVKLMFDLLADTGLGAERAVGFGHFCWEQAGQVSLPDAQAGQPFLTLSRYHPRPEELPGALQSEAAAYHLVSVGGWVQAAGAPNQRRRRLWLVAEGSLVQAVGPGPWGDVTDVRPRYEPPEFPPPPGTTTFAHPVWRYGLACPIAFGGA